MRPLIQDIKVDIDAGHEWTIREQSDGCYNVVKPLQHGEVTVAKCLDYQAADWVVHLKFIIEELLTYVDELECERDSLKKWNDETLKHARVICDALRGKVIV